MFSKVNIIKIIVFAPHPDDECYGAGGPILKWLEEGHEVGIIWLTDGRAGFRKSRELGELEDCEDTRISEEELGRRRIAEAKLVGDYLGVKKENQHFLKFHDQELKNHIDEGIELVKKIVIDTDRFVIPSDNNNHPDHQATQEIAIRAAEELKMNDLEFYVYAIYNPLKAQDQHLTKIKVGDLRFKVYKALLLHKHEFYTKDMHWQSKAYREMRRYRFGVFSLKDRGKFYNF